MPTSRGWSVTGSEEFEYETPAALLGRLKLGREELCQRLLTSLLLHGPYPRWNSRSALAPIGLDFLRRLHEWNFGDGWPDDVPVFVDELELAPRHDAEKRGAPDYAVLWDDRLWLIELKTEKASHRADQVPYYFELAHHHYPNARIDLTYLTSPMDAPFEPDPSWARYAHETWGELTDLIKELWAEPTAPGQQEVVDGLLDAIDSHHMKSPEWMERFIGDVVPAAPELAPRDAHVQAVEEADAMGLAQATADDHRQRGVEVAAASLEELLRRRLEIREQIASAPPGSPLRHVRPWIWRTESTGAPLTAGGAQTGMEVRLSWYRSPLT